MSMTNAEGTPQNVDATIGERVHQLMWRAQVTQTTLAPVLGIGQTGLSPKLRGKRGWSADELLTISRFFNVSLDYLFGNSDDMGPGSANLPQTDYEVQGSVIDLFTRAAVA